MRYLAILILLLILLAACSDTKIKMFEKFKGGEVIPLDGEKTVPFRIYSGHVIAVDARFNDRIVPVVLDTGGMTMIGSDLADSLGLELHETPQEDVSLAKVEHLLLGEVEVLNLKAVIMPFGKTFSFGDNELLGMVGSDFFRFYQTTFDYETQEMTFRNPSKLTAKREGDRLMKMTIVPPYFPTVETTLNGELTMDGLIDTGLNHAFVIPINRLEKMPQSVRDRAINVKGFFAKWPYTDQTRNVLTLMDEIRIGDIVMKDVPVIFADLPFMMEENVLLIGKHFMDDYRTTLDFHNRQVLLEEATPIRQSIRFSTGINIVKIDGKLGVRGLWEGSPADIAGFRPDDEIVTINGRTAEELDNKLIRLWTDDPEVKSLSVTIMRDGKLVEIDLDKVDLFD